MSPAPSHHVAALLQRVLLPPRLPDIEGWGVAAMYEPAGEAVLVGGDFYDWFTLPNGNVLFLVGDVSGKGPIAGALAMSIRKALKGITWVTPDLGLAVTVLQRALTDELAEAFASLCLLELTPGTGRVRVMLAGHPPPLVRRGGVFQPVEAPANGLLGIGHTRLFGIAPDYPWESVELDLAPDDMLVVFTDGLLEARVDDRGFFGEGTFQRLLARLSPTLSSYDFVIAVDSELQRACPDLTDDVIIAALTYHPTPDTS